MPSASLDRLLRVVSEIERVRSSSCFCSSMRVKVVLPAPDGEERISISPRRPYFLCAVASLFISLSLFPPCKPQRPSVDGLPASLDILRLFAQLLDFDLQFQPEIGQ